MRDVMKKLIAGTTLLVTGVAQAGGIQFGEPGTQAMERGGAFVAKADDPSALWTNPAGLSKTKNISIYLGGSFLGYNLTVGRTGVYPTQAEIPQPGYVGDPYPEMKSNQVKAIPSFGVAARFGDLALSVGLYGPQGNPDRNFECSQADAGCQVNAEGAPAPTRYDVVKQHAIVVFPSIGASYRVHDTLDVGVRLTSGIADIEARSFTWGITNPGEDPELDGDFALKAKDWFIPSFGVGALYRPLPSLEVGLSYKFETSIRAKGDSQADLGSRLGLPGVPDRLEPVTPGTERCDTGGTPANLKACINTKIPMALSGGVRWIFRDQKQAERGDIEFDVRWEDWSNASDTEIIVDAKSATLQLPLKTAYVRHGYHDTFAFRLGGSYAIPVDVHELELRAGAMYETGAAPVSWTRADQDAQSRIVLASGLAFRFGRITADAGFAYGIVPSRTVTDVPNDNPTRDNRTQPDPVQPLQDPRNQQYHPMNAGKYDASYWLAMVGVTVTL
jgi:long-subunit fatty acid transport protein